MIDWVLVLDDASKGYRAPGRGAVRGIRKPWHRSSFAGVFAVTLPSCPRRLRRAGLRPARDETTTRRHDETFVSHFDGLCSAGGAALRAVAANGGEPLIF